MPPVATGFDDLASLLIGQLTLRDPAGANVFQGSRGIVNVRNDDTELTGHGLDLEARIFPGNVRPRHEVGGVLARLRDLGDARGDGIGKLHDVGCASACNTGGQSSPPIDTKAAQAADYLRSIASPIADAA